MFLKKKPGIIGLDIGSSSIKLVEFLKDGDKIRLANCGLMPIPRQAIVESAIMDSSTLVDNIKNLFKSLGIKNKRVAISISGNSVIIKKITLSVMSKEELSETIKWEAEQYIPFDIKDVNIDVHIVSTDVERDQMDVILVAAKSDIISDYTSLCSEAGLKPEIVDVDASALENCFTHNYQLMSDEIYVLANIGASVTNINIIQQNVSAFTRDINIGGDYFTDEIQKQMNIPFEQAEALKMGRVFTDKSSKQKAVIPQEVQESIRFSTQNLAMELHKSIEYFSATFPDKEISKIYISGGSAKISGVVESLTAEIDKPVFIINPFEKIVIQDGDFDLDYIKDISTIYSIASGLSLRGLDK